MTALISAAMTGRFAISSSLTTTVGLYQPPSALPVAGVPVISPLLSLMLRPGGRPKAE